MVEELRQSKMNNKIASPETHPELFSKQSSRNQMILLLSLVTFGVAGLGYFLVEQTNGGWSVEDSAVIARNLGSPNLGSSSDETQNVLNMIDTANQETNQQLALADKNQSDGLAFQAVDPNLAPPPPGGAPPVLGVPEAPPTVTSPIASNGGGRPDPFEPLLNPNPAPPAPPIDSTPVVDNTPPPPPPPPERDVVDSLQFVGMVDDKGSATTVAVMKIEDPILGKQTLVKRLKEMFILDGHKVYLKKVDRFSLVMNIDGKQRTKLLSPFIDTALAKKKDDTNGAPEVPGANGFNAPGANISASEKKILKGLEGG
jgi:hypothetical protein